MEIKLVIGDVENKEKLNIMVERERPSPPTDYDSLRKAFLAGRICYCETEYGLDWVTKKEMKQNEYRVLVSVPVDILEELFLTKEEVNRVLSMPDGK